jgi:hypothetical protein
MSAHFASRFTPSISVCGTLGAVRLTRPGDDGIPASETLLYVTDPQQLRDGTQPFAEIHYGIAGGETDAPVLVINFMAKGTACYLLLDPLDPAIGLALDHACAQREFIIVAAFGEHRTSAKVSGDPFSGLLARFAGRQHAGREQWLRRAAGLVYDLPFMFAEMEPELRGIKDHRVVFTLPYDELRAMCGA